MDEHSVDSKAFIDLPLPESAEVRGLVAVGHCRELCVELADLMLIRSKHVLRDASDKVLQEAGHVFHPRLCSRSGSKDGALGDAALFVRRAVEGCLRPS